MDISRSFYFIRHGQTDWNVERRLQGSSDIPLNETGMVQAKEAAENTQHLPIDLIISSPLQRALKTAEIINEYLGAELVIDDRLSEKHYGVFEGKFLSERKEWAERMKANNPEIALEPNGYPAIEDAEPYEDFEYRICEAVNEYMQMFNDANILVVAHAGVFRAFHRGIFGETKQPKNAQPFLFEKTENGWNLKEV